MKKYVIWLMLWSCMSLISASGKYLVFGHRGASGHAPENTLASFEKAIELGADAIELDVHRCASGEIVVMHDETVDRTTNDSGYVEDLTLKELKQLDAGNGQTIPTLREVLDLVNQRVIVDIELKGHHTAASVAEIIHEYVTKHGWNYDDFFVSSFNHHELSNFHRACPDVKLIFLLHRSIVELDQYNVPAYAFGINIEFVDQSFVEALHERNLNVFVYTVNEPEDIERVTKLGVDGVFSDYPDRL